MPNTVRKIRYLGIRAKIVLLFCSLITALIGVEVVLRILIEPSDSSTGKLLGAELPPVRILPAGLQAPSADRYHEAIEDWCELANPRGGKPTHSDLNGIIREHELIGYVPLERATSTNGWWQSNNLGARSRVDVSPTETRQRERVLLFGDSFIHGSRVRQEETPQHYLTESLPDNEIINFGVDGYSLSQAFLYYQTLQNKLGFDRVILFFMPIADLWREINVSREVGQDWDAYMTYPRFIIENGDLRLIESPYRNLEQLIADNRNHISNRLTSHLEQYDAFYFRPRYQRNLILDSSILFRLYKRRIAKSERSALWQGLMRPQSEALQITKRIAQEMDKAVAAKGAQFSFVIIPSLQEVDDFARQRGFEKRWAKMSSYLCSGDFSCFDAMDRFQAIPRGQLDVSCDGWHYGAQTNRQLSEILVESIFSR